jgi:hypothetical protein
MAQACHVWRADFKTRLAADQALIADLEKGQISTAEKPTVKGYRYNESSPRKYLIQLTHDY